MKQQSDPKELEKMINEILSKNKDKVDQYKAGKRKIVWFFCWTGYEIIWWESKPSIDK